MRKCPDCSKPTKRHGEPALHGNFLDQIVVCPGCGWCGVRTEMLSDVAARKFEAELTQLPLFEDNVSGT